MHYILRQQVTTYNGRNYIRSKLRLGNGRSERGKEEKERSVDKVTSSQDRVYNLIIFSLLDKICFTYVVQMIFVPDLISPLESVTSFNQVVRI